MNDYRSDLWQHQDQALLLPPEEDVAAVEQRGFLSSLLQGFSCKIVCKPDNAAPEEVVPSTTEIVPANIDRVDIEDHNEAADENESATVAATESPNCRCGETREARIVCPQGRNCTAPLGAIPWQVRRGNLLGT